MLGNTALMVPLSDQLDKVVQVVISSKCKEAKFEIKGDIGGA